MPRIASLLSVALCLAALPLIAGCGDLFRVPPPPVPLGALDAQFASAGGEGEATGGSSSVRLLRAVPPGSLLLVHLPDIGGTIRRFKETSLYKIFSSPEFEAMLGPLAAGFRGLSLGGPGAAPGAAGAGGFSPEALLRSLRGELVLALEDLTIDERGGPPQVRALLGISVRGAERQAEQFITFVGMMTAADRSLTIEKGTHAGTAFTRIVGRTPVPFVIELGVRGDALLVGLGRETVTTALTRVADERAESLADDTSLRRAMERCADPRDALRIHLDLGRVVSKYARLLPPEAQALLPVAGLSHMRAFTLAVRLEGKDLAVSSMLDSPGGQDILTKLLSGHLVDRQFLTRIPAGAASFTLFALDGTAIVRHLRETLPPEPRGDLEEAIASLKKGGFALDKDIFEVFGPRCAVVTLRHARGASRGLEAIWSQFLATAFVVEVHDEARAAASLAKLPVAGESARRRETLIEGVPAVVHRFENAAHLPNDFALAYAIHDGYLVAALSEETLRRMLQPRSADSEMQLREALRSVPESVAILTYDDMRSGLGLMTDAFLMGMRGGAAEAGDPAAPVASGSLFEDLNPSVGYTLADSRGVFSFSRSPTGGLGGVGGVSGLLASASLALPTLITARAQANETSAIATLRAIYAAQEGFRARNARDGDGDGDGEFGLIADLMARARPGERRPTIRTPLLSGLSSTPGGDWTRNGYQFRAYLPAEDGSPVGDHEGALRIGLVDGDLAETVLVVVAWPIARSSTGTRAFLMNASGQIWQCFEGTYGAANAPPPDLFNSQKGNLASQPIGLGETPRDGCRWLKLRE